MTTMFGIANCDTIKKAKKWLNANNIDFEFHDYKKQGANTDVLNQAIAQEGVDIVVNKRGTTYRALSDDQKQAINDTTAIAVLSENTSMIKRPILIHNGKLIVGFKDAAYQAFFDLA